MYNLLFIVFTIFVSCVFGTTYPNKSSYYGCPDECETQKNPKCECDLPDYFVALHPRYFESKPFKYCENYYVGMTIDSKADGGYKMVKAKVVDQCGSCAETQVDLNQRLFEKITHKGAGIVEMVYVIMDKSGGIMDGPHYSSNAMSSFVEKQGKSKKEVLNSFVSGAKKLVTNGSFGYKNYPWKEGVEGEDYEEKKTTRRTTTRRTTTRRATTTKEEHEHEHTTRKTTSVTRKTTTVKKITTTDDVTSSYTFTRIVGIKTTKAITTSKVPVATPVVPVVPVTPGKQVTPSAPVNPPAEKPQVTSVAKPVKPAKTHRPAKTTTISVPETNITDDGIKYVDDGGSSAPVTAGVIGGFCAVAGAAGVGLMMLKRKSPQRYDEMKQKFPEAFNTVKRSFTRGATTIKRGVSRSLSRRGTTRTDNVPSQSTLPNAYSFTINSEDGLPRVALYDDPYPTKHTGAQHW